MSSSSDLQWLLVKNQSSFIVRRDNITFTKEPNNVMNVNSFKYSGLANNKAVGVEIDSKTNKITFTQKRAKGLQKPKIATSKTQLTKHRRSGTCRAAVAIRKATAKSYYRADLANAAVARYHRLYKSIKSNKSTKKA